MIPIARRLAAAAVAAVAFAACNDGSTGPSPTFDQATIDADLREMALKIKAFGAPEPPDAGLEDGGFESAFKRSAAGAASDCDQEGISIETGTEITASGGVGVSRDTIEAYTADDALVCASDDQPAYEITRSHFRNDLYESWFRTRSDIPDLSAIQPDGSFGLGLTGSGRVHYFSGYDFEVDSLDFSLSISLDEGITRADLRMDLSLDDGRYTVPLGMGPGLDLMSGTDPDPDAVMYVGPIRQNGATVGWFEVLGDERVVIRDQAKNIVEVH